MATRELIKINDHELYGFNVSKSVGIGGDNDMGDVLVVRTMIHYIAALGRIGTFGVQKTSQLPPAEGAYDKKLGEFIFNYQRLRNYWLMSPPDGLVHPASYKNRNVVMKGDVRLMTITQLHHEITMWTAPRDYTVDMKREFPKLNLYVKDH